MDEESNKPVIIFGILLLVVFSGVYFIPILLDDNSSSIEQYYFNGFLFEELGPLWYTQIQVGSELLDIPMHYGPRELLDLDYSNSTADDVRDFFDYVREFVDDSDKRFLSYLTFDPEDNLSVVALAAAELSFKLRQTSRIRLVSACTKNSTDCSDRMIITCDNTDFPVIYLNDNDESYVNVTDNCLEIAGRGPELMKLTNRVLYSFFGIMS